MINRRGSLLWSTTLGNAILTYKPGDLVKSTITVDPFFIGVVQDVDLKINKIMVSWGNGPVSQHDADEIMLVQSNDGIKTASRRMKADVDDLLDTDELDEELFDQTDALMAANPSMDQFCGRPDLHGLNTPVSGGTSVMKDLAYALHEEANEFADVNPRVSSKETEEISSDSCKKASREVVFYYPNGTVYATVKDMASALKLFQQGRWDFSVAGRKFRKNDWRGREEIENVFGESRMHCFASLKSRRAMYWFAPDRTYRLTQQEQDSGMAVCPQCKTEMTKERFTRAEKLLSCPDCGFKLPSSKAVTKVNIKVPEGIQVDVTTKDAEGNEVSGQTIVSCRRGSFIAVGEPADPELIAKLSKMSLSEIAQIIRKDWKNVNYAAKPYLDAMSSLDSVNDDFGQDSGRSIVAYFLSNANSWKGETAKAVKKELNKRIK
jgi:predicted RNA-binding Zn-ribbon protein involved in translation (DUF1610 family)